MAQATIYVILLATLALFLWGRWRYDLVAAMALLAVTLTGLVPPTEVFLGFGHPAVITVAAVLIVSRGLSASGLVDRMTSWLTWAKDRVPLQTLSVTGLTALLSGFINDVGALGLMMPVAVRMSREARRPSSTMLMSLAFSSILGGLMTAIGTPPNIYISAFRAEVFGQPFRILDFLPIGVPLVIAGVPFVTLIGWRLLPNRAKTTRHDPRRNIEEYLTELHVPKASRLVGARLDEVFDEFKARVVVLSIVREPHRLLVPSGSDTLQSGDILIVETGTDELEKLVRTKGFELAGKGSVNQDIPEWKEATLTEAVVLPEALVVGNTARDLNLRQRYRVNLLAISRQGESINERLGEIRLQTGDVLLLQGDEDTVLETVGDLGCLPLLKSELRLERPRRMWAAAVIFLLAITSSALGLLLPAVAFSAAAVLMILTQVLTLKDAYASINWPVILLLGCMIPVGKAFEASGASQSIGRFLAQVGGAHSFGVVVAIVLVVTMLLANVIKKSAATVVMAPLAVAIASEIGISADPLLLAVAVGASSAYLTPFGHHCNTLVMGPGGYRFGDYWRMGLPLSLITIAVAIPAILWAWPP